MLNLYQSHIPCDRNISMMPMCQCAKWRHFHVRNCQFMHVFFAVSWVLFSVLMCWSWRGNFCHALSWRNFIDWICAKQRLTVFFHPWNRQFRAWNRWFSYQKQQFFCIFHRFSAIFHYFCQVPHLKKSILPLRCAECHSRFYKNFSVWQLTSHPTEKS